MDLTIPSVLSLFFGTVFSVIGYLLIQRDKQRTKDMEGLQKLLEREIETLQKSIEETSKAAAADKEKTAALLLKERDVLALQFRKEYKELDEKFVEFRVMVARDYATTTLVEKILSQITAPLSKKLDEIENLLNTKLDKREFEQHARHTQ